MVYRICGMLFLWCAYVQINDPDPVAWTSIYLVSAITLEMAARDVMFPIINCLFGTACIIGSILSLPTSFGGFWGDMAVDHNIELAREATGLLLVASCQFWICYKQRNDSLETV